MNASVHIMMILVFLGTGVLQGASTTTKAVKPPGDKTEPQLWKDFKSSSKQLQKLEGELPEKNKIYQPDSPAIRKLHSQIEKVKENRASTARLLIAPTKKRIKSLKAQYDRQLAEMKRAHPKMKILKKDIDLNESRLKKVINAARPQIVKEVNARAAILSDPRVISQYLKLLLFDATYKEKNWNGSFDSAIKIANVTSNGIWNASNRGYRFDRFRRASASNNKIDLHFNSKYYLWIEGNWSSQEEVEVCARLLDKMIKIQRSAHNKN